MWTVISFEFAFQYLLTDTNLYFNSVGFAIEQSTWQSESSMIRADLVAFGKHMALCAQTAMNVAVQNSNLQ